MGGRRFRRDIVNALVLRLIGRLFMRAGEIGTGFLVRTGFMNRRDTGRFGCVVKLLRLTRAVMLLLMRD